MTPRLRPYGDRALLAELGDLEQVVAWAQAVRDREIAGVQDVVPAAETVLVVLEGPRVREQVRAALQEIEADPASGPATEGEVVEIPVRYDGPDLADVARLTGMDETEVVSAHTGQEWRAAFSGFAPGFCYLVGEDTRLEVPRRESARTSVPVGSVGLAGPFSGVYPTASPGGWQLIGHTDAVLWDLERDPPALLGAGDRVRFVEADR